MHIAPHSKFGSTVTTHSHGSTLSMKALSPSTSPRKRTMRRVSKPVMEKRRRERINHSLEALRLLMLESTNDEKMKNPKVEKAEILESVVQFLEKEVTKGERPTKRGFSSSEQRQSQSHQRSYSEGVRSCLRQVSHFIASRSQESQGAGGDSVQAPLAPPEPPAHLIPSAAGDSAAALPHHHRIPHPYFIQSSGFHFDSMMLLSPTAAPARVTDPVWRPWPQ